MKNRIRLLDEMIAHLVNKNTFVRVVLVDEGAAFVRSRFRWLCVFRDRQDPSGHLDNYLHATVVVVRELFSSSS